MAEKVIAGTNKVSAAAKKAALLPGKAASSAAKSVMSKSTSPKFHAVKGMQNAEAQSSRSRKAARQREAEQSSAQLAQGVGERVQALVNASETQRKQPFLTDCVLLGHAKSAALVFTVAQWFTMCLYMLQGNDFFLMPYEEDGAPKYARSKPIAKGGKVRAIKRMQWAWDTICERAKTPASIGFYPKTERGESKFAAFDVDAHDGGTRRARLIAGKLFAVAVQHTQLYVVLATSGNGGWHLFLFAAEFRSCDEWTRLLRQIAEMAGVQLAKGRVEIFPDDTRGISYAIIAPGAHNPKTGRCGKIAFESITGSTLLHNVSPELLGSSKEITSLSARLTTKGEKGSLPNSEDLPLFRGEHGEWREQFAIIRQRQRHHQLLRLVGAAFHQCAHQVARKNAALQYVEAEPTPSTPLEGKDGHLEEFEQAWTGMHRQWLASLTPHEQAFFDKLETDTQRDAFRVIRNWSQHEKNEPQNFPVNAESLAQRLGMTIPGVCKLRRRFCELGIMHKVTEYVPRQRSACFAWMSGALPPIVRKATAMFNGRIIRANET